MPQEMPWLSNNEVSDQTLRFGQFYPAQANIAPQNPPAEFPSNFIPAQSIPSQSNVDTSVISPVISSQSNYVTPRNMFDPISNPPFNPNTAHLLNQPCLLQERIHPTSSSSISLQPNDQLKLNQASLTTDLLPASLTHLPLNESIRCVNTEAHLKRGSSDMEDDDLIKIEEPPTKQLLSEQRLFKQFGSLHLNKDEDALHYQVEYPDEEGSSDDETDNASSQKSSEREQFSRYVYLLFKDKKSNAASFGPTDNAIDRLVREQREKHSKAVILWTPPLKSCIGEVNDDSDSDDEVRYTDHRDFLKSNTQNSDSITITEIVEDTADPFEVQTTDETHEAQETDSLMQD